MDKCVFCKILRREIPARIVYDNAVVTAFLDAKPVNPGHVLVVPKVHSEDYASTSDETLAEVAAAARRIAKAVMAATGAPAFNIAVNNGPAAGQVVPHMHLHVIPRFPNDGRELWHGKSYEPGEAEKVAADILNALSNV